MAGRVLRASRFSRDTQKIAYLAPPGLAITLRGISGSLRRARDSKAKPNGEGVGIFEPDFEEGTEIQFMLRDTAKMVESAKRNSSELTEQIKADGNKPLFGMYIDCAGRISHVDGSANICLA